MEEQKRLFEIIRTKLPKRLQLANEVQELLGVSADTAYKRIRGETDLSFSELVKVCRKYNVSLDEIVHKRSNQGALIHYAPVVFSNQESCIHYFQLLLEGLKHVKAAYEKEMINVAQVVPFYYFLKYPELTFFKLYVWSDMTDRSSTKFDGFLNSLEKSKFTSVFEQIYDMQSFIPSKEIWSEQTIDTTLRLIEYYFEMGAFESKDTALFLLDQLSQLLDTMKQFADNGYKGGERKTPFELYVCSVDLGNAVVLTKSENHLSCIIRVNAFNNIATDNELLCTGIQQWMNDLISKSIQISVISVKERVMFFQTLKNKINDLAQKIKLFRL